MEVQSECAEPPGEAAPPCDPPQPTGKINKAAFKLFGKRRSGSGMAGFFSFRNKGSGNNNNGSAACENGSSENGSSSAELIRSKTHDGLGATNNGGSEADGARRGGQEVGTVRSLSKSLSFFSLLRRGSLRATSDSGGAGLGRRGRGLKGLFSSMRWRRKDKGSDCGGDTAVVLEGRESLRHQEEAKDITLTLEPPPQHHQPQEDHGSAQVADAGARGPEACAADVSETTPLHRRVTVPELSCELDSAFPYTPTDSPLRGGAPPLSAAKSSISSYSPPPATPPPGESCCSTADPPSEPSVDRLCSLLFTDVTSLKSFDSLTGCGDIIADADEEAGAGGNGGGSGTSSSSSGGGGGVSGGGPASTTSRGSPCKGPLPTQIYTTATGSAPASLPARARVPPPPAPQHPHPTGSGVVAYMGGGEEMASPEGVDDADMQGLWHMLPSTGDNSPALPPRSHQTPPASAASNPPPSHHRAAPQRSGERKPPQVKALGLSKIPVVGGGGTGGGAGSRAAAKPPLPHGAQHGRHAGTTSPPAAEKEPLSDEGYWDTPSATPTATPDEGAMQQSQKIALSRDSCSGDHLYDLYNDPEEEDGEREEDDLTSTPSPSTECKMSPPSATTPPSSASSSSFRSMRGSASLPRDSKIPISVCKTTPPHSVSQSALSSVVEAADAPPPRTEVPPAPARTRIPVSKVPVRRSAGGNATRGRRK